MYDLRRHNIVAQYIATQPIMDLCKYTKRRTWKKVCKSWWDQEGMYLMGALVAAAAAEDEGRAKGREGELGGVIDN